MLLCSSVSLYLSCTPVCYYVRQTEGV